MAVLSGDKAKLAQVIVKINPTAIPNRWDRLLPFYVKPLWENKNIALYPQP